MHRNVLFGIAALAILPATAQAATITVVPTLAPNAFGSPSWPAWQDNAVYALEHGLSSYGTPNDPTHYQAQSNVTAAQAIVTGFPSWMGKADPGSVFGPQFANELGNRMTFGVYVNGDGQQISIDQLSFDAHSSDPADDLGFGFAGGYNYSTAYVGILKGADGMLGTADDQFITSGPSNQLVDAIAGRGSGNSDAAYCPGCTIAQQQQAIDDAASYWRGGATFTGTYSLAGDSGSGTFNIAGVPEPATWALMILGFGGVGATMRKRLKPQAA